MWPCMLRIASAEKIIKATSRNDLLVEHAPWCRTTPKRTPNAHQASPTQISIARSARGTPPDAVTSQVSCM